MLVDTDVIIWYLRGHPKAAQRLDNIRKLTISAVTYLELLQGCRNQAELRTLQRSLALRNTQQLSLTPAITERAVTLMETLTLSHGLQLGDALIAATGLEHGLILVTANIKHFQSVAGLTLDPFSP